MSRGALRVLVFLVVTGVGVAYAALRLEVRTSITDFLPRDEHSVLLELARELSSAPQSRLVVLTLSASTDEAHRRAAGELADRLRQSGHFEWVRRGLDPKDQEQLYRELFPSRLGLLELPSETARVPDAWIAERLRALRARLGSPLGMLERRLGPEDPLGSFSAYLARQGLEHGQLDMIDGQLVTKDGRWSVVLAATRAAAFDVPAQREVERAVIASVRAVEQLSGPLQLEWSGLNRFAIDGETSVRADIQRISTLSLLGIFLLNLVMFRTLRVPFVVLVPIAIGCVLALGACQWAFGFVHGITLAFGASVIGVAQDYSTHFFMHRRASYRDEDDEGLMRRLWPGIAFGGVTTILGLAALSLSGFPGLEQLAVFGGVGVLGALVATRYLVPLSYRQRGARRPAQPGSPGARLIRAVTTRRARAFCVMSPALAASLFGLPRLSWDDDVSALRTPTPALDAEGDRVQARLGRSPSGQVVVALGHDDEEALRRAERARALLDGPEGRALVREYRSIARLLPSLKTQRETRERLTRDASFIPRLRAALTEQGYVHEAFRPFEEELARAEPVLLTPGGVLRSPLGDLVAAFRAELPSGVAYLTPVTAAEGADLDGLFQGHPGIYLVDQASLFSQAYARVRTRVLTLMMAGLVLSMAALTLRYRSVRIAALALLPPLVGAGAALGVHGLLGVPATWVHALALLPVLSMGIDYGIYVLESRHESGQGAVALGSIALAAATSVLSFGLLAMSSNPALSGMGLTIGLGIVFTASMSPLLLTLTREATS